jgi:hypothetical protein
MVGGVLDFGLGALVLLGLVVLVPKLFSRLEQRRSGATPPGNIG